jgi:predicted ATPase/class 3 adenylate cyclase
LADRTDLGGGTLTELPSGVVTFLITDIEGATRLLQGLGDDSFAVLLEAHRQIIRVATAAHDGVEIRTEGDGCYLVFTRASDAVAAATEAQLGLLAYDWPPDATVRVRMGLHTGEARLSGDHYVGLAVHEVDQIAAAGHGGQILLSAATKSVLETSGASIDVTALGPHRLRGLGEPIAMFQLRSSGLPTDFAPLRSLERASHNLPVQASPFLGREADLVTGGEHLALHRLVTLVGPGGIGKTRLALHLAADQVDAFDDGAWVVQLAGLLSPDLVAQAVANAIGLVDEPGGGAAEAVLRHLQTRRTLLVIDNCEHVVAAVAELVDVLLDGCPDLTILATSRQPLRLPGELVWALSPLEVPDATDGDDVIAASDSVRLFSERASQADGRFSLSPDNSGDVVTICRRLDGMPLAIELAAARSPSLTPAQIAERLDRSLDLLTKGKRTSQDRQSTLRGAIAWSEELLSEPERTLFARLSVFQGRFDLDDVEAVCTDDGGLVAGEDSVTLLGDLVDKSLVVANPSEALPTYGLLQTIADYAVERLAERGERDTMQRRHYDHFAAVTGQGAAQISGGGTTDLRDMLVTLEAKHDNIRAALGWAMNQDDADLALRLALDAVRFWDRKSYFREGRRWIDAALTPSTSPDLRCQALHTSAAMSTRLGDNKRARPQLEEAHRLALELGLESVALYTGLELGTVNLEEGEMEAADQWYEGVQALARKLDADEELAGATLNRGLVKLQLGDLDAAASLIDEAVVAGRRLDSARLLTISLVAAGTIAIHREDLPAARAFLEESLDLTRESGDEFTLVFVANDLAEVLWHEGEIDRSIELYRESLAWCRASGALRQASFLLLSLAGLMADRGSTDEATVTLGATFALNDEADIFMDPFQLEARDKQVTALRDTLGEVAYEKLLAQGRALAADEAMARAERWIGQNG